MARCTDCGLFFCRECVAEHDDRILCAACLRLAVGRAARAAPRGRALALAGQVLAGLVLAWLLFFAMGRLLLRLPSSFHEGTRWAETLKGAP